MPLGGLSREGAAFFRQLAARQDRDWFKAQRQQFVALWERPMLELVDAVAPAISRQYRGYPLARPKHFRVWRDVRFSKDKSPFKTHAAAMIGFAGSEALGAPAALYLQFGTEDFVGAGHWGLTPERLKRFRALVADGQRGGELQQRLARLEKKGFTLEAFERLKRVPRPFEPDHPRARLLKMKGLGLGFPVVPAGVRHGPKLAKWLIDRSAEAAPVVKWIEDHL